MKKFHFIGVTLAILIRLASACSPQATPAAAPPTDTVMPTVAASSSSAAAAGAPANIMLAKDDKLGSFR